LADFFTQLIPENTYESDQPRGSGVPRGWGGIWGVQTPRPEILKALQNCAKLIPIVKTVKNC